MDSKNLLNLKMYLLITCVPFAMIYFTSLKGAYPVDIYFVILASEDWVVSEIENVLCVEKKLKNVFQVLNCLKNYLKNTPVNMKKDFTWNKNLKLTGIYFNSTELFVPKLLFSSCHLGLVMWENSLFSQITIKNPLFSEITSSRWLLISSIFYAMNL